MLTLPELDAWHPPASGEVFDKLAAKETAYRGLIEDVQHRINIIENTSVGPVADNRVGELKRQIGHWNDMIASCERLKTLFVNTPQALEGIKQRESEVQHLAERYEWKLGEHGELVDPYNGGNPPGMSADDAQHRKEIGAQIQDQIKQVLQDATGLNDKIETVLLEERRAMDDVFGAGAGDFEEAPADSRVRYVPQPGTPPNQVDDWWQSLSDDAKRDLEENHPDWIAGLDGVPFEVRTKENRKLIERERAAELARNNGNENARSLLLGRMLDPVPDPSDTSGHPQMINRQILLFDPSGKGRFAEWVGKPPKSGLTGVTILTPGTNTTIDGIDPNVKTANNMVHAAALNGNGQIAAVVWAGGDFPNTYNDGANFPIGEPSKPDMARDLAPKLVSFAQAVDHEVGNDPTGAGRVPLTVMGHSYGGAILGEAEHLGLRCDRAIYVEAAGAGPDVHSPADWHNQNPNVSRYSMTAPWDPIAAAQGADIPGVGKSPLGPDTDHMPGVTVIDPGYYREIPNYKGDPIFDRNDQGSPGVGDPKYDTHHQPDAHSRVGGPSAHGDVFTIGSDSFTSMVGVVQGTEVRADDGVALNPFSDDFGYDRVDGPGGTAPLTPRHHTHQQKVPAAR